LLSEFTQGHSRHQHTGPVCHVRELRACLSIYVVAATEAARAHRSADLARLMRELSLSTNDLQQLELLSSPLPDILLWLYNTYLLCTCNTYTV
jgi:hypothetical protein